MFAWVGVLIGVRCVLYRIVSALQLLGIFVRGWMCATWLRRTFGSGEDWNIESGREVSPAQLRGADTGQISTERSAS